MELCQKKLQFVHFDVLFHVLLVASQLVELGPTYLFKRLNPRILSNVCVDKRVGRLQTYCKADLSERDTPPVVEKSK